MAKGNRSNHPNEIYARIEHVKKLEGKFDNFLTNEHPHLVKKVDGLIKEASDMKRRTWITTGILIIGVPLVIMLVQMVIQGFIKP